MSPNQYISISGSRDETVRILRWKLKPVVTEVGGILALECWSTPSVCFTCMCMCTCMCVCVCVSVQPVFDAVAGQHTFPFDFEVVPPEAKFPPVVLERPAPGKLCGCSGCVCLAVL